MPSPSEYYGCWMYTTKASFRPIGSLWDQRDGFIYSGRGVSFFFSFFLHRSSILRHIRGTPASRRRKGGAIMHNTGFRFAVWFAHATTEVDHLPLVCYSVSIELPPPPINRYQLNKLEIQLITSHLINHLRRHKLFMDTNTTFSLVNRCRVILEVINY